MIRFCDFTFSSLALLLLSPLLVIITLSIFISTRSNPFFLQKRLGVNKRLFYLLKFRSLKTCTDPYLSTHDLNRSSATTVGLFIRKYKIDELPQLINVMLGSLSLVGPRPCLPSQDRVIDERQKSGIFDFKPGITGLAQLSGIDMSTPILLAKYDEHLVNTLTFKNYILYILSTLIGKGKGDFLS